MRIPMPVHPLLALEALGGTETPEAIWNRMEEAMARLPQPLPADVTVAPDVLPAARAVVGALPCSVLAPRVRVHVDVRLEPGRWHVGRPRPAGGEEVGRG